MILNKILVIVNDYNIKVYRRAIKIPFMKTCCYNEFINICNSYCKECVYYGLCEETVSHRCRINLEHDCNCCDMCIK